MTFPLPLECIEFIVDYLDATIYRRDLLSLLTVNKGFFAASARRLYADPIETIRSQRKGASDYPLAAARGLLTLVLRCSPDDSPEAQSLRNNLDADIHALPRILTMNYLSLIKTIQYDADCFGPTSALALQCPLSISGEWLPSWAGLHDAFAWAVCTHRLSEIRSLEIPLPCLPLFDGRIEDMLSIRTLQVMTLDFPRKRVHKWTPSQVEAVERDLTIVSWFVSQWSAASAKLPQGSRALFDIQFSGLTIHDDWWRYDPFASELRAIFLQLPVSSMCGFSSFFIDGWMRFILAPESIDLARVRSIVDNDVGRSNRLWPNEVMADILQQCRSLQKLLLCCYAVDFDALFQWAVQERQRATAVVATSSSNSEGNKPREQRCGSSLIPLSELQLLLLDVIPSWKDALFAFGTTLQRLTIWDIKKFNEVDLCVFCDMPALRHLCLSFRLIKAAVPPFSGCPRLTELRLHGRRRMDNDQDRFEQWDLAKVRVLSLRGEVCYQFNQATLKNMPKLENLNMCDHTAEMPEGYVSSFTWDRSSWGRFPKLKTLELSGAMAKSFCWSMLEQCPVVDSLSLNANDMYTADKVEFLLFGQQSGLGPTSQLAVYPTLRILELHCYYISDAVLFNQLPRVAPNLTSLTLWLMGLMSSVKKQALWDSFEFLENGNF